MNIFNKNLIIFLFSLLINKIVAQEEIPVEQNDDTNNSWEDGFEVVTDCDNLKLVLGDSASGITVPWEDHSMGCCDYETYVCKNIDGKQYITEINLSESFLQGDISRHFANFTNLEKLDVHDNQLTGGFTDDFKKLKNLKYLYIYNNDFNGTFPSVIGEMTNLRVIDASSNRFSGALPKSLSNLSYLENLTLRYNLLSGEIPDIFSNMQNVTLLDLSKNQFEGKIPKSIKKLTKLSELNLEKNNLKGSIPDVFSDMKNFTLFYVTENKDLSGNVPDMPSSLKNCNYKRTDLCVKKDAICGKDQVPECKVNKKKIIVGVIIIIAAVIFVGLLLKKYKSKFRFNKRKQSDEELLVEDQIVDADMEEGEFIQLREENHDSNKHYVEVDEDYFISNKHMNRF